MPNFNPNPNGRLEVACLIFFVLIAAAVSIEPRFTYPNASELQLLTACWPNYLLSLALIVLVVILASDD